MAILILMNIEEEQSTFYLVLIHLTNMGVKTSHYMEGAVKYSIPAINLLFKSLVIFF